MKTTVDIPEKELLDAMRFTGAKTKKDAVTEAIADYNRRRRMARLVEHSGAFTSMKTNEEIEGLEELEDRLS
ncbi:MAG TPA: type II toxin-antitoxin system VapB family antitoxin [Kiritimatiellia bacterium]|nr:type II toxin-antitoxin system VapB family antitoxin [Kiritimatiellia bacterium]